MANSLFSPIGLDGKTSPYSLNADDWKMALDYISLLESQVDVYSSYSLTNKLLANTPDLMGPFGQKYDQYQLDNVLNPYYNFFLDFDADSVFWILVGPLRLENLGHHILAFVDLLCVKNIDGINQIINDLKSNNVTELTENMFKNICIELKLAAIVYDEEVQPLLVSNASMISLISRIIDMVDSTVQQFNNVYNTAHENDKYYLNMIKVFLENAQKTIRSKTPDVLSVFQKLTGIWSIFEDNLETILKMCDNALVEFSPFLASLDLEVSLNLWQDVKNDINRFLPAWEEYNGLKPSI